MSSIVIGIIFNSVLTSFNHVIMNQNNDPLSALSKRESVKHISYCSLYKSFL